MKKSRKFVKGKAYRIPVPHMGFTILYGKNPREFTDRQQKSIAFCEDTNRNMASIIFRDDLDDFDAGTVAHEVMHALQYMCRRRNISMEDETEHMGYLMQYVFNEIYGRKYDTRI